MIVFTLRSLAEIGPESKIKKLRIKLINIDHVTSGPSKTPPFKRREIKRRKIVIMLKATLPI
jgi:hypothetical protein